MCCWCDRVTVSWSEWRCRAHPPRHTPGWRNAWRQIATGHVSTSLRLQWLDHYHWLDTYSETAVRCNISIMDSTVIIHCRSQEKNNLVFKSLKGNLTYYELKLIHHVLIIKYITHLSSHSLHKLALLARTAPLVQRSPTGQHETVANSDYIKPRMFILCTFCRLYLTRTIFYNIILIAMVHTIILGAIYMLSDV